MLAGLIAGTVFVGVQGYGLWWLLQIQPLDKAAAETGTTAFVFAFAGLHALHVSVALLFLTWVTLQALSDRYDHEYYWGVTVCAGFWHVLAIVWFAILAVFAIAM